MNHFLRQYYSNTHTKKLNNKELNITLICTSIVKYQLQFLTVTVYCWFFSQIHFEGFVLISYPITCRAAEEDVESQRQELMAGFDDALRKREHEFRKKADDLSNSLLASELKVG